MDDRIIYLIFAIVVFSPFIIIWFAKTFSSGKKKKEINKIIKQMNVELNKENTRRRRSMYFNGFMWFRKR